MNCFQDMSQQCRCVKHEKIYVKKSFYSKRNIAVLWPFSRHLHEKCTAYDVRPLTVTVTLTQGTPVYDISVYLATQTEHLSTYTYSHNLIDIMFISWSKIYVTNSHLLWLNVLFFLFRHISTILYFFHTVLVSYSLSAFLSVKVFLQAHQLSFRQMLMYMWTRDVVSWYVCYLIVLLHKL